MVPEFNQTPTKGSSHNSNTPDTDVRVFEQTVSRSPVKLPKFNNHQRVGNGETDFTKAASEQLGIDLTRLSHVLSTTEDGDLITALLGFLNSNPKGTKWQCIEHGGTLGTIIRGLKKDGKLSTIFLKFDRKPQDPAGKPQGRIPKCVINGRVSDEPPVWLQLLHETDTHTVIMGNWKSDWTDLFDAVMEAMECDDDDPSRRKNPDHWLNNEEARDQLLKAIVILYWMMSNLLIHCDIKLENFIVKYNAETGDVYVAYIDFSLSVFSDDKDAPVGRNGSGKYVDPRWFTIDELTVAIAEELGANAHAVMVTMHAILLGRFTEFPVRNIPEFVQECKTNGVQQWMMDIFEAAHKDANLNEVVRKTAKHLIDNDESEERSSKKTRHLNPKYYFEAS